MVRNSLDASRIVRMAEVVRLTGKSRATIYRDIRDGRFPPPNKIGKNAVGWKESEIRAWLDNLNPSI